MDRMIFTALNGLGNLRDAQSVSAQNLSNQNVPGFRRDLVNAGPTKFLTELNSLTGRAFQTDTESHRFSNAAGFMDQTGEMMDVAIEDDGYFYIETPGGTPALSRRGDMRVDATGLLTDGAGNPMLDSAQAQIVIPPFQSMTIDDVGQIVIEPMGGAAGETEVVGVLATVKPDAGTTLQKSDDGHIRLPDGKVPVPNQGARVVQGVLERSNVNTTEELIASIELQRSFEVNLRLITAARDMDEAGASLMRMPEG
jgi:flagellar basal-body rod protein FlgF